LVSVVYFLSFAMIAIFCREQRMLQIEIEKISSYNKVNGKWIVFLFDFEISVLNIK